MAKQKGNGEGTIFYDQSSKKWRGQITLGYNNQGKAVRKSVSGSNKTEVREKIRDLLSSNLNLNLKYHSYTLEEWLNHFVDTYKKPEMTENSYNAIKRLIRLHITPTFGHMKLSEITREDIQIGYNRLFGDRNKYSQSLARKIANVLSQAMKKALLEDLIDKNPTVGVTLPKVRPERKIKPMSIEEQKTMVKYWESNFDYNVFVFLLATGMRIGEVLGMTYEFLDLENREYRVEQTMIEVSGNARFQPFPKTDNSVRTIFLNEKALDCIKKQIDNNDKESNVLNLVFPNRNYNFKGTANLRRILKRTFEENNITPYNMHALRHTYATRMVEKGVNIKFLQSALGHKNVETTLQIYSEALNEFQRRQADEINIFDWNIVSIAL